MSKDSFESRKDGKIDLKNDGTLEVYFVGVGSAFATETFQSNMVVVKGDHHFMIDMGSKASVALRESGLSVMDIENLLVTHSHADHIGGVEEWCLRARYEVAAVRGTAHGEYKPNLITTADYARILWDASLRGGLEHSEEKERGRRLSLSDYVTLRCGEYIAGYGRPVYRLAVGDIDIKIMRTNHLPDSSEGWWTAFYSVGVLIDDRVLISGDTLFDKDFLDSFGNNAEVIFHDCQNFKGGVHASYEELRELPDELKAKMYLYHLPDGTRDKYNPEEDGFKGWTESYCQGSYKFSK